MTRKLFKDISHYLPLFGLLLAGFIGFYRFSNDISFQKTIVIATASSYAVWGIVHHHIHKDLHVSVLVEYVLIAIIGVLAVFSLI